MIIKETIGVMQINLVKMLIYVRLGCKGADRWPSFGLSLSA
jgi:hypothetical protein